MSVEKFTISHESVPFTQVSNNIFKKCKYGDALLLWGYLACQAPNWKVVKTHLKDHFGFGNSKLKKIFTYLACTNLIEYVQKRDGDNRFDGIEIRVLNGSRFAPENDKNSIKINTVPAGSKMRTTGKSSSGKQSTINKEAFKKKDKSKKKESINKKLLSNFVFDEKAKAELKGKNRDEAIVLKKFKEHHRNIKSLDELNLRALKWCESELPKALKVKNTTESKSFHLQNQSKEQALAPTETKEQKQKAFEAKQKYLLGH